DHFTLLKAGPPKTARLGDYLSVVQFNKQLFSLLQELRNYDNLGEDTQEMVQEARVFPALTPGKTGYRRAWVSASEKKELRWQDISSKSARVPSSKYLYIDAEFTYRPGGRITNREAIASNNAAYREFLSRVGIRQHSVLNSLIDTHVLPLTKGKGIKPEVAEKHWIAIYDEYWIKQSMLERERKEVVLEFLDLLPSCQLPVMLADRAGTHTTTKASKCFVGDRFHADTTELFREYLGSGAAIVHFAGFSAKAKVDWQDWRQFLSDKCGVHTEPYLVDKTLMDDNVINTSISNISVRDEELAKLNPFMADIARAVISHHQFKEDYGNFEIHYRKEGEHQKLDADSHYILYNNRDSDFLARSIATKLWMQLKPEININVSWKYKASCTLKVKNKYFDAYVVPHLRLRDNTGKLVSHGTKTFFYCKANTEILGSLGVYIKDSDYGGNSAFLVAWGVKREVDAYDVLRLHDIFLEKVESGAANLDEYLQYIKMSCRYLQGLSEDREIVQKSLHLWNPELAEKQPAHLWISSAYRNGFPEDLISDVRKLMVDRDNYSPDELLDVIFGREHDLGAGLYKLISDLGAKATGQESDLEKDIEDRIAEHGISLMGRKVFIRDELPVVWLINLGFHKEETDTAGIWVIAPETATEAFRKGLDVFGWPTSDDYAKTVEFENQRIIHPTDMHKLEKMYCDSDEHLNQENRIVNKTWLEIIQRIKSNAIIICQGLYFGVNGTMLQTQYALHDKLYLNESIYPLFSLLYSLGGAMKPEITKKLFDAFTIEEEEAEEISQPGYQTNENRKNGGANPSSGSDHAAKEESGGSGKQRDPDSKNKEYRTNPQDRNEDAKPYAFYRTGIYSSKPSSIRQDTKRETGKKGEQIAAQAEIDSGRKVEYQPENNPGYDLISHSESEDRYIEVKTVNGSWSHVLLTAREFAASQEYKERYWVYVVELLGDDMHRLTRIQNPFAKVTHYSLDDGWRVVENPGWYSHNDDYEDLYES
ncbi:MAG: DUF3883 domain-containing protein, partial [Sphaerochaetaceae bacterium]|nr:DUF3883 domain-containing protein [Sphaerochaetaceae bacterium]